MHEEKYRLKKLIKELKKYRGRHTELISVYVPQGYNLNLILNQLSSEQGTAQNIKSKTTRKNVLQALEKIMQELKLHKKTPKNGMAVFGGNVSEIEGRADFRVWVIEPPKPLKIKVYRCDQTFLLEPLEEMILPEYSYGLIVIDNQEAAIGFLKGKSVTCEKEMTSIVPGKYKTGGQCIDGNTLLILGDGVISKASEVKNCSLLGFNFNKNALEHSRITNQWVNKNKKLIEIITKFPRKKIITSEEHTFFVLSKNGIVEKQAKELKIKDALLITTVIPEHKKKQGISQRMSELMGYFLGDGSFDDYRISFAESDEELLRHYQKACEECFKCKTSFRFRERKNYFQLRASGKKVVEFMKKHFEQKKSLESSVPKIIMKSNNKIISSFLRGFFDAEGFINKNRVGLGVYNELLANQVSLLLLKFGIISSVGESKTKKNPYSNNTRFLVEINDWESIINFMKHVNFNSKHKKEKLARICKSKPKITYTRRVPILGSEVIRLGRKIGLNTRSFDKISTNYFRDEAHINRKTFEKRILPVFEKRIREIKSLKCKSLRRFRQELGVRVQDLAVKHEKLSRFLIYEIERGKNKKLEKIYKRLLIQEHKNLIRTSKQVLRELKKRARSQLSYCLIKSISVINEKRKTYDFSVKNQNFFAAGILVHNSAARFQRVRENLQKSWYKEVSAEATKIFGEEKSLKGIIVGGPGPAKEVFIKELPVNLRKKVISVEDIGYSNASGLQDLVNKAENALKQEEVMQEKKILHEFFNKLNTKPELVSYGEAQVRKALELGAVSVLLLSEELPDELIDELRELSAETRARTEVISTETSEGVQFHKIGGIGAILRYPLS